MAHRFLIALTLALLAPTVAAQGAEVSWGEPLAWSAEDGPEGREHAAFVVEPGGRRALLVGGSGYRPYGSPLADAWALDLAAGRWSALALGGEALVPAGSRRAAWAPAAGTSAGDGGAPDDGATADTGAVGEATSDEVADGGGATGDATTDPADDAHAPTFGQALYLHGGYAAGFAPDGDLYRLAVRDGGLEVARVAQHDPPPARFLHAFAHDDASGSFVVFGGVDGEWPLDDTWIGRPAADGVHWTRLETDEAPRPRFGFAFALDQERRRLLVCGGQVLPEDLDDPRMVTARDLWALDLAADPPAWSRLATWTEEQYPGRRNPAWAFDQARGDLFVWGGTGDGQSALAHLYAIATRAPGAPVTRLDQSDAISTRASGFGLVDGVRGRALLGFGNDSSGAYLDLAAVSLRRAGEDEGPAVPATR